MTHFLTIVRITSLMLWQYDCSRACLEWTNYLPTRNNGTWVISMNKQLLMDTTVYPKKYAHGFCFAVLCCGYTLTDLPYPSGLLHWHCGNLTIAPVPAKQPWLIWINTSCEFIMNDCITTTKQSTTKPCAYFLGYTVCGEPYSNTIDTVANCTQWINTQ